MEFTFILTGVKCDLCNFVWIASYKKERPETLKCPNCEQIVEFEIVSLDKLTNDSK